MSTDATNKFDRDGNFTVLLSMISMEWIDNYRKSIHNDEIETLRKSIDSATVKYALGVKQPPLGSWNNEFTQVLLVDGACRVIACYMIALAPLIKKYNETFGFSSADDGFIAKNGSSKDEAARSPLERLKAFEQIKAQGGEWATEYDKALATYSLNVTLRDYGDVTTEEAKDLAMLDSFDCNENRNEVSFADKLNRIELFVKSGMKASKIADRLGLTEGQVSQFRKVSGTPEFLRTLFASDAMEELKLTPTDLAKERDILELAVREFEGRIAEKSDRTIGVSHAREFSGAVQHKTKEMTVKQTAKLLKQLVRMTEDGKTTNQAPPEISSFKKMIEDAFRVSKLGEQEEVQALPPGVVGGSTAVTPAPAKVATAPAATAAAPALPVPDMSVAALADKQAAENLAATAPVTAPTADSPKEPESLSKEAQQEAELKAANARAAGADVPVADDSELGDADLDEIEPGNDELSELATGDEFLEVGGSEDAVKKALAANAAKKEKPEDGKLSAKRADAEVSKYKLMTEENIEKFAVIHLNSTQAEEATLADVGNYAFASMELFNVIGMTNESTKVNESYVEYSERLTAYIVSLQNFLEEKGAAGDKDRINALKPTFEMPKI